ncbi:microtubule-associated protein futsch [Phlebotomus argentipes]|uniref:microtubule-associated protein futsch n=1 Tax=Phlebotomus argentipes TaxID=94469 RepID=UPI002892CA38|nr:microtubule-associated protein futsch [Phlebotomus argentipes]
MEEANGVTNGVAPAEGGPGAEVAEAGPPSMVGIGPPSPLTGCYLLIVIGEPYSQEHKDIIIQRLVKGFLSWDVSDCHVDLEEELNTITLHAPEGEEARHGERLIQYASENLVTEILIHPQYNTLIQCMRNLLSSFTRHRHIIHAGYTFSGNGSWILQDGTFSVSDFSEAFQEHEVQRVLRAYPDTITMDIHCAAAGLWTSLPEKSYAKLCKIRINPVDVLNSGSEKINAFIDYLAPMVSPAGLHELLETSDVVGNIRFSHPTLYVFPGGQGDAALFGINGFNMLVDGGFNRKACFWDFARHLDRLDAVLMTRLNNCNINGISAVAERKQHGQVYPQIGHFFCNIPERKNALSPDGDKDRDPLLIDLNEKGHQLVANLRGINLKPQVCYRDTEPINLYHKVGHGTLDMYVISPSRDAKEVKEFLHKWAAGDSSLFMSRDAKEFSFPIQNLVSICALLVWQPASPEDTITRILFPGSTPDYKITEGLDKIKHLEFMKHPVCSAKTIAPSLTESAYAKKALKAGGPQMDSAKILQDAILPSKAAIRAPSEKDNRAMDNKLKSAQADNKAKENKLNGQMESSTEDLKIEKQAKATPSKPAAIKPKPKLVEKKSDADAKSDDERKDGEVPKSVEDEKKADEMTETESSKDTDGESKTKSKGEAKARAKVDTKAPVRSRIDSRPPKSMAAKKDVMEKRDASTTKSSPTSTPKKTADAKIVNGTATKAEVKEVKAKVVSRTLRSSPGSTPAKSAKEANNRKVLESKKTAAPAAKATAKPSEKKEPVKVERKPISRRPKGESPPRRVGPGSPIKSRILGKVDRDAKLRKAKIDKGGTTDSSLVSTPSADDAAKKAIVEVAEKEIDPEKQRELDEMKEEQEAVREIEAVFKRDQEKARQKQILAEHRDLAADISKQDSTTEAEEEEEYLIIEKEEVEQYTEDSINEPESSMTKEEEIQKYQRDSEESEKKRKASHETEAKEAEDKPKVVQIIEGAATIEIEKSDAEVEEKSEMKEKLEEEVQDIISSAKEIAKTKADIKEGELAPKTEEISTPSPEDKLSSTKKTTDTKDEGDMDGEQPGVVKDAAKELPESQPDEKISATIESGATTAPTLPEDERIPLDEIKEDLVIEEKYVKEDTKEIELPDSATAVAAAPTTAASSPPKASEPMMERAVPQRMQFPAHQTPIRDIIKTPDEVADLPVHEEVDYVSYDTVSAPESKDAVIADAKSKVETDVDRKELDKTKEMEELKTVTEVTDKEPAKEIAEEEVKVEKTPSPPAVEDTDIKESLVKETEEIGEAVQEKIGEIVAQAVEEIEEVKEQIEEKGKEVLEEKEQEATKAIDEVAEKVSDKLETISKEIDEKFMETAEKVDSKIAEITQEVQEIEEKAKSEVPSLLGDIADSIKADADKIGDKIEDLMIGQKVEEAASLPYEIKGFTTELRETHITTLDSPVKEPERILGAGVEILEKLPEHVDEEKETSPQRGTMSSFQIEDIKYTVFEREDSNLNDIKEEDEDERESPPRKTPEMKDSVPTIVADKDPEPQMSTKTPDLIETQTSQDLKEPKRSVSPRTPEEVAKIVANVAEVLKSDKDLEEIIPDFDPEELERKLSRESARSDAEGAAVQRMLVTASSEDGGEEIEICPEGSITFTPEIASGKASPDVPKDSKETPKSAEEKPKPSVDEKHDLSLDMDSQKSSSTSIKSIPSESKPESGKSSPDIKTSPISIEEKDKHELSEKVQQKAEESPKALPSPAKSAAEQAKVEEATASRRESALSLLSEKDITKDETSLGISAKDSPRSHSAASHASVKSIEELEQDHEQSEEKTEVDEKKSSDKEISRPESAQSAKETALVASKEPSRPESTGSEKENEALSVSKEPSRPESAQSAKEPELMASKEPSRPESADIGKESAEKEASRPASVVSEKEKETLSVSKEPSRPESAQSAKETDLVASKEPSRPESADVGKESAEKEVSRPASVVSEKEKEALSVSKEASRPESAQSAKEPELMASKEPSRPESTGSEKEKEALSVSKEPSRPESSASEKKEDTKDATPSPHAEASRPESSASDKKEEVKAATPSPTPPKEASRPESVAKDKADSKAPVSKEPSRPESVSSHVSDEKLPKESSRPESVTCDKDLKPSSKEASRPESTTGDKEEVTLKAPFRPESSASVKSEKQEELKGSPAAATSRPESSTSVASDKEVVVKSEEGTKAASKEPSRPESVASAKEEVKEVAKESPKEVSRPESVASVKEESPKPEAASKEPSRPESAASGKDSALKVESKEASRPASSASAKEEVAKESPKEVSRPESVASVKEDASKVTEEVKEATKDASRPESVASAKEETSKVEKDLSKESPKELSRPESVASAKDEPAVASKDVKDSPKETSRPESSASVASDKEVVVKSEEGTKAASKEPSRPESVASAKEEVAKESPKELSRPESVASAKEEVKEVAKESPKELSRPESVASAKEESPKPEAASKEPSRPESAASGKDSALKVESKEASRPASSASAKEEVAKESPKEVSRPESVVSVKDESLQVQKEAKDVSKESPKELSRPESAASVKDEPSEVKAEVKEASRADSIVSAKEEITTITKEIEKEVAKESPKEMSRPESVAETSKVETESPKEITRTQSPASDGVKEAPKEVSRPESAASVASKQEEDQKVPSKESSRPASTVGDKDAVKEESPKELSRPESASGEKQESELKVPSKEPSRPESAQEKEASRPESAVSHVSEKETELKVKESEVSKESSRPASVASHVSEKEEPAKADSPQKDIPKAESKEASRPESRMSEKDAQEGKKESPEIPESSPKEAIHSEPKDLPKEKTPEATSKESSRPESATGKEDEGKTLTPPSKGTSRPESAASVKDEAQKSPEITKTPEPVSVPTSSQGPDVAEAQVESSSRPESIARDDEQLKPSSETSPRPQSVTSVGEKPVETSQEIRESPAASDTQGKPLLADVKADTSRPASSASQDGEKGKKTPSVESSRPESQQSHHDSPPVREGYIPTPAPKKLETSRPGSALSDVDEKYPREMSISPRPDSVASHASDKSPGPQTRSRSSSVASDRDEDEKTLLKEIRSKSVSSIMVTSMYGSTCDSRPLSALDEVVEYTKDDAETLSKVINEQRPSSGCDSFTDKAPPEPERKMSISPENEVCGKLSPELSTSGKSSPLSSSEKKSEEKSVVDKLAESLKGEVQEISSQVEKVVETVTEKVMEKVSTKIEIASSSTKDVPDDLQLKEDKKTPPTAPVSPGVKATPSTDASAISTPKDVSAKSSPGASGGMTSSESASKSMAIGSVGEASKESPQPTEPFPKITPEEATQTVVTTVTSSTVATESKVVEEKESRSGSTTIVTTSVLTLEKPMPPEAEPTVDDKLVSDEEVASSPLSATSHASKFTYDYDLQRSSSGVSKRSEFDLDESQDDIPPQYGSEEVKSAIPVSATYRPDPMSASVYGALPEETKMTTETIVTSKITLESVESKKSADHKFLDEADLDFEKAMEETRQVRGPEVMSSITSKYEFSPSKQSTVQEEATFHLEDIQKSTKHQVTETASSSTVTTTTTTVETQKEKEDLLASWGKPLGLPSPAPMAAENEMKTTPKKERKLIISKTKMNNEKNLRKRSESPIKGKKSTSPVYIDLTYVPHHGNSYYAHVEFFKRVRARYYVFSGTEPSRDVYNALLEAKQTWENKDLEVTIIPTYDTDVLGYWVSENEDLLAKYHIDLSPSASRCTINLQDHETSCSAYRLEF